MRQHETHIGDGVYVYLEHGSIWLETPRGNDIHSICLEQETYEALVEYVEGLKRMARKEAKRDE